MSRLTGWTRGSRPVSTDADDRRHGVVAVCTGWGVGDLLEQLQLTAEHRGDQLVVGHAAGEVLTDQAAVAQHRHPVGDLVHLIEEMRYEQHRRPTVTQAADDPEQLGHLVGVQAGCRFVEDQHLSGNRGGPGDCDQLLDRDRMGAKNRPRIDVEFEIRQQLAGPTAQRAVVDAPEPAWLTAQQDVLGDGEVRAQVDLLVHRADAGLLRLAWPAEAADHAVDRDAAAVDVVHTGQCLDQS